MAGGRLLCSDLHRRFDDLDIVFGWLVCTLHLDNSVQKTHCYCFVMRGRLLLLLLPKLMSHLSCIHSVVDDRNDVDVVHRDDLKTERQNSSAHLLLEYAVVVVVVVAAAAQNAD